jgi:hypothetical protein
MDASLQKRAEQLATEFAGQARTAEDLNGLMRLMMKSALERMLNTELDVHLGRRSPPQAALAESPPDETPAASESGPAASAKLSKRAPNRRNGKSPKTEGDLGELTLDTPATGTERLSRSSFPSTGGGFPASMRRFWPCTPKG